ncbi:MAG: hypothetical protein NTY69_04860 [Methylococcales bacterium]|nr:hypothetical protein [Methylococcales bacterium]
MRNKRIVPIAVIFALMNLIACGNAHRYSYEAPISYQKAPEPKFIGWDKKGHKKFDTDKVDSNVNDSLPPLKEPQKLADITPKKALSKSKNKKSSIKNSEVIESPVKKITPTILNEDAIICETDSVLLNKKDSNGNISPSTGSSLLAISKLSLEFLELDKKRRDIETKYLSDVQSISAQSGIITNTTSSRDSISKLNTDINEEEASAKQASDFLKLCKATNDAQDVEVIERRPISNIAKIKIALNNSSYEVWTYEYFLTSN